MTAPAAAGLVAAVAILLLGIRASTAVGPSRAAAHGSGPMPRFRRGRDASNPSDLDIAAWCDDLARELRSGSSLATAMRECPRRPTVARATRPIVSQLSRGRSCAEALSGAVANPSDALGLALTVLRSCAELGGPAASPLERVAATLRDRDAIRQEQRAQSAQARMSARVMTLVPLGMLALLVATDDNVREAIGTTAGFAAVSTGALLNLTGWWWMQRIIGRPV